MTWGDKEMAALGSALLDAYAEVKAMQRDPKLRAAHMASVEHRMFTKCWCEPVAKKKKPKPRPGY